MYSFSGVLDVMDGNREERPSSRGAREGLWQELEDVGREEEPRKKQVYLYGVERRPCREC